MGNKNSSIIMSKTEEEKIKKKYLSDPRVINIYNEIKKERSIPEPTPTPTVENFEDIKVMPLNEKINNDLKKKFNENFKF
tara:strand:+ start:852 stop:1091 length:240 start_codon:yes stop_codon:yes gene_type:complete